MQTETKADFPGLFGLQEFADLWRDVGAAAIDNPQITRPTEVTIGGHRALQYEVSRNFADLERVQLHTTVETDKNDHHILVASSKPEFDRDRATLETIVQSFQEVPADFSAESFC